MRYDELTLREFVAELQKHEELMDMKVISLGGGTGGKYGCFNMIALKDEDGNRKEIHVRHYREET